MARIDRVWVGIALAVVGSALTVLSLWLMPRWVACLIVGAATLGVSYRLLAGDATQTVLTPLPGEPAGVPAPQPGAATPVASSQPLLMNVSTYQDGQPMGKKQIPIRVSAHAPR